MGQSPTWGRPAP